MNKHISLTLSGFGAKHHDPETVTEQEWETKHSAEWHGISVTDINPGVQLYLDKPTYNYSHEPNVWSNSGYTKQHDVCKGHAVFLHF